MAKKRPSGQKYKQSPLKTELFRHLFRTMYLENTKYMPEETISRSEYEKLSPMEQMRWYFGKVVPDDEYKEPAPRRLWNNTINGLTEDMKNTHLALSERMGDPNSIYAMGPKEPKINKDNVRNAVEELVEDGILDRFQAAHNQYMYFPKETLEGFRAYVRRMLNEQNDEPLKFLMSTSTTYYRRMMDRQLVTDVLKECNVRFSFTLKRKDGETFRITSPVVGRFKKIFELSNELNWYIERIESVRQYLYKSESIRSKDLEEMLYEPELRHPEDLTAIMIPEAVDTVRTFTDGLVKFLQKAKESMDRLNEVAENGTFKPGFDLREQFWKDGGFVFRREALWEDMVLTAEDKIILRKKSTVENGNRESIQITDEIMSGIVLHYPSILEERVILPIMCLVEMSPSAMYRFFLVPDAIRNQTFSLDTRDYGICDENGIPFFNEKDRAIPGFSIELDKLMSEAQRDYDNKNTLYPTHEFMVNSNHSKTCLYRVGEIAYDDKIYPAQFTFRINDGRYLSMYHSLPFKPITRKGKDDFIEGPKGVSRDMLPTFMYGGRWKTPEWLVELFELYVEGWDHESHGAYSPEEFHHMQEVGGQIHWFIQMLRHNLHTDVSLVLSD